jgi:hypothetical protein
MFKRFPLFATLMVIGFGFLACEETETPDENKQVTAASYSGTLSVDQLDSTYYDTDSVVISIAPQTDTTEAGTATNVCIVMKQVRFSPRMPLTLDITLNDVAYEAGDEGFALSCDTLVPYAMGGPFPSYLITNLHGLIKDNELTLSMKCGRNPLTYSGRLIVEP